MQHTGGTGPNQQRETRFQTENFFSFFSFFLFFFPPFFLKKRGATPGGASFSFQQFFLYFLKKFSNSCRGASFYWRPPSPHLFSLKSNSQWTVL